MIGIEDIAIAASGIIFENEGGYASVNRDDNGALSIGKLQWHGERARTLLEKMIKEEEQMAKTLISDICIELDGDADWSSRCVNADEASRIASFISLPVCKQIQDECAIEDICKDVKRGVGYGLRNCGALIYFADGANQYGRYSSLWKNAVGIALKGKGDLDALHCAVLSLTDAKLSRRVRTYEKVKKLDISAKYLEQEKNEDDGGMTNMITHKVVKGDTLSAICKKYNVKADDVLSLNKEKYPSMKKNYIVCGWTLLISAPKAEGELDTALAYLYEKGMIDTQKLSELDTEGIVCALYRLAKIAEGANG